MTAEDFATRIAAAYATDGPTVDIGRAVLDGTAFPTAVVQVPTAMCNRHGLIAGATGTGKTVTLQLLAEQLSAQGVAVFTADIKGDLSGLVKPSVPGDKITSRVSELGLTYTPTGSPVQFWALGGQGPGVPVRATVSAFGPQLLAKVLGANETQSSSLALVFYYADQQGLPLLDLVDLVDLLKYLVGDDGKAELKTIGGLSSATAGVLLRKLVELQQQDAELFFGEPEVSIQDLIKVDADGRGIINCLELAAVQDRPKLFSTFLMWLLAELFEELPEVGDLEKPKLVFFFDEAHLLFNDAPKAFVDQVAQTVRLIRSKGVGVFFVTQLPDDVPDAVLAQLGNRVQHALRAYTPRDAKALKAAVSTYPKTDDYDLEEVLTQLGTGEAIVTTLTTKGAPTPVAWTKVRPPQSQIGAVDPAEVLTLAQASPAWAGYAVEVDRRSARELLAAKMGITLPPTTAPTTLPGEAPTVPAAAAEAAPADPAASSPAPAPTDPTAPASDAAVPAPGLPPVVRPDLPPPPAAAYEGTAPSPDDLVRDSGIDSSMTQLDEPSTPTTIPMRTSDPDPINRRTQQAPTPAPAPRPRASEEPKAPKAKAEKPSKASNKDGNPVTDFLGSREGRATVNNVVRGVFDLLKKRR